MTYWTGHSSRTGKSYPTAELLRAAREAEQTGPLHLRGAGYLAGIRAVIFELDDIDELLRPAPPPPPPSPEAHDAERRANLAVGLLMSVRPSDRALAGWGIEREQLGGVWQLAMRAPDDED